MNINDSITALEETLKNVREGKIDCLSIIALGKNAEDRVVFLQVEAGTLRGKIFEFLGNIYKMGNNLNQLIDYSEPNKGLRAEH